MMKLKYLICNHKNKLTYNELKKYTNGLKNIDTSKVKFVVCPSLPYIYNFIDYELCSQDISQYEEVITGETTGKQLKELLIKYVLIGHAERRKYLKELIEENLENTNYTVEELLSLSLFNFFEYIGDEYPGNVLKLCRELGISEKEFYSMSEVLEKYLNELYSQNA